jgi:hypothetical protein
MGGTIGCVLHQHKEFTQIDLLKNEIVPNKRLYPETCDYEFCRLLVQRNQALPFTTYNETRSQERFYGRRAEFFTQYDLDVRVPVESLDLI